MVTGESFPTRVLLERGNSTTQLIRHRIVLACNKNHIYSIIFLPTHPTNYSAQLTLTLVFCSSWQRKSKLISLMKLTPKISIPTCRTSLSTFRRTVSVLWSSCCCCFFQNVEFQKAASEPHSAAFHSLLAIRALKHVNVWLLMHILVFFFLFVLAVSLTECYHTSLLTHQLVIHIYSSANKDCMHYIFIHITECVINVSE